MEYATISNVDLQGYKEEVINFLLDRNIDVGHSEIHRHVHAYIEVNYPLLSERVVIATEEEIKKKTKLNPRQDEICPLSKHIMSDLTEIVMREK